MSKSSLGECSNIHERNYYVLIVSTNILFSTQNIGKNVQNKKKSRRMKIIESDIIKQKCYILWGGDYRDNKQCPKLIL